MATKDTTTTSGTSKAKASEATIDAAQNTDAAATDVTTSVPTPESDAPSTERDAGTSTADTSGTVVSDAADPALDTKASTSEGSDPVPETDALTTAPADPAPATELTDPSGAIAEPSALAFVDLSHPSVDANPRAGTSAAQNQIDFNDPAGRTPNDMDFEGLGIDPAPYGKAKG